MNAVRPNSVQGGWKTLLSSPVTHMLGLFCLCVKVVGKLCFHTSPVSVVGEKSLGFRV